MKIAKMSAQELVAAKMEADLINKKVNHGREGNKGTADKDMFMKLLVTQLKYQDPTRPMEDREFIAQMAQFSTLEQMTNMNKEIIGLVKSSRSSEAFSLLGKHIDAMNPATNRRVSGVVTSIQYNGDEQVLMVGNEQVRTGDIHAVRNVETGVANATEQNSKTSTIIQNVINNAIQKASTIQTDNRDVVPAK
jgi:flagellar basal-body rod modification protein FlgD